MRIPISDAGTGGVFLVGAAVFFVTSWQISCSPVLGLVLVNNSGQNVLPLGVRNSTLELVSRKGKYLSDTNEPYNREIGLSEDVQCDDYHKLNGSQQCLFIKATNDCRIDDGFINYLEVAYCDFSVSLLPLPLVLLFIWLIFLFVALGVTAEDFFCPSLTAISKSLKLSQNIAGVTFLAFGNGAPDIFSAIAAITNAKNGDAGLAIGALFGAGVFVTTVVAGSVSIAQPFELASRPFLRDAIFYIGAAFWTFYILYTGKIWTMEAIGFILLYVAYVLIVVVGRTVYQSKIKPRQVRVLSPVSSGTSRSLTESEHLLANPPGGDKQSYGCVSRFISESYRPGATEPPHHVSAISDALRDSEQIVAAPLLGHSTTINTSINATPNGLPDLDRPFSPNGDENRLITGQHDGGEKFSRVRAFLAGLGGEVGDFLRGVNPIDVENWQSMSVVAKVYEVFKSPIQLLLQSTIPLVDHTEDKHCWNRLLNSFQLFVGPLFCATVTKNFFRVVAGGFLLWQLMMIVGFLLACLVYLTSKADKPPPYHYLFAYVGFIISVLWIYSVANEIVNLLQMYGTVFQISNAILGLTLLAWGNSIGDLVSDIAVAKQGYPRMAVAACFGGPLFNMLLGIGISCTIACIAHGGIFYLQTTHLQMILAGGLVFSLFFSLFYHVCCSFKATKVYGFCLYGLYVLFLAVAMLTETKVINW